MILSQQMFNLKWVIAVTNIKFEVQVRETEYHWSKQTKHFMFETYNLQMFTAD